MLRSTTCMMALAVLGSAAQAAVQTFTSGVDLTVGANYDSGTGSTPGNTTDILFDTAYPGAAAVFQLGTGATATSLAAQSIDSVNSYLITIGNNSSQSTASNATLTLGNPAGQNNGVSGAAAGDLIYVGGSGNLTLQSANLRNGQSTGSGTMSVALAQSGNFDVATGRTLTVTAAISGAYTLTKTGAGILLLNAGSNSFSNLNVKAGVVQAPGPGRFGAGTITLGDASGTSDVTLSALDVGAGSAPISNAIVVNTVTSGTIMITHDAGGGTAQNPNFSGAITLNGALTVAERRSANRVVTLSGQITGNKTISVSSNNISNVAGVQITNASNASSFSGNIAVTGGLLGFNSGSLGTGLISFDDSSPSTNNNPGLVWLGTNSEDVSARLQPVTSPTTVVLNTGTNAVPFATANGLSGSGNFSKAGTGTLNLAAANNYSGSTTVSAGTLLVNNPSGSATGSGTVTVNAGSTLGGAGRIGGVTTISGLISPGNDNAGTLTVNNNLNINSGSTYIFEGGDLINAGGTLDLNDNWTLALRGGLRDGGEITLFTYGSLAATPDLVPTFDVSQLGFTPSGALSLTSTGTAIILHGVQMIPEPAALSLLGVAGALSLMRRRRLTECGTQS